MKNKTWLEIQFELSLQKQLEDAERLAQIDAEYDARHYTRVQTYHENTRKIIEKELADYEARVATLTEQLREVRQLIAKFIT